MLCHHRLNNDRRLDVGTFFDTVISMIGRKKGSKILPARVTLEDTTNPISFEIFRKRGGDREPRNGVQGRSEGRVHATPV